MPNDASTHRTLLGAQRATRSPGCTPLAMRARATCSDLSRSWMNVIRSSPSTTASWSPNLPTAASRAAGIVEGADCMSYKIGDLGAPVRNAVTYEALRVERQGPVGWLIFDRPAVGNAMDATMLRELEAAWRELDDDPAVHVIVNTGEGPSFQTGL